MKKITPSLFVFLFFGFLFLSRNEFFSVSSIPLILFGFLCLIDWRWTRDKIVKYRFEISLVSLALFVGIVFSGLPSKSVKGAYDFFRGAILFFPAMYIVEKFPRQFTKTLPWATFFGSVYLWVGVVLMLNGYFVGKNYINQTYSLILGHYNMYGGLAAVVCILGFVGVMHRENRTKFELSLMIFSTLAGFCLTVFSGSRGSALALCPAIIFAVLIRYPRFRWHVASAGIIAMGTFFVAIYFGVVGNLLKSWERGNSWSSGRLEAWPDMIMHVYENALLTGYGVRTFKYLQHFQHADFIYFSPHNIYIESFYSLGLIGSCLLLAPLLMLIHRERQHFVNGLFLSLGGTLICFYLIRGLTDMGLFNPLHVGYLALSLGLMHGTMHSKQPYV